MTFSSASASARRPGAPTTSPTKRMFMSEGEASVLPCVFHGAGLPDDRDLDLPGVLQLGLDLLGHVARQPEGLVVGHAVGLDDDAQLAAGLDRESLLHALESVRDVLQLLEPLDVGL